MSDFRVGAADAAGCLRRSLRGPLPRRAEPGREALRDDAKFAHIAAWEHNDNGEPIRHSEPLQFTALQPSTRSYK